MNNKRNFSRINFAANAQIELKDNIIEAEVLDISLKGTFMRPKIQAPLEKGDCCTLKIFLHSSDIILTFNAELVHIQQKGMGFKFLDIDIDTMTHLRRLLDLNTGDQDKIINELPFMLKE